MHCVCCKLEERETPASDKFDVPVCEECSEYNELHVECACCHGMIASDEAIYIAFTGEYFHENNDCYTAPLTEDDEIGCKVFTDAWEAFFKDFGTPPYQTTASDLSGALVKALGV